MRFLLPRLLGVATAAYGAAITAKPELLLKPSGLPTDDERLHMMTRTLGVRDFASGVAMAVAPTRKALRVAIGVRVASDVGDAAVLGSALAGKPEQKKVLAIAGGWAVLCALSALATKR